jgi:DNA excision repair protein ERCC-2
VCIESLSIDLTEDSLRKATRGANNLERKVTEMKSTDAKKLQNEYEKLVAGLREADEGREEDAFMANPGMLSITHLSLAPRKWANYAPALPDDLLKEAVPGNIRRAEHFIAFLKRFVEYLKVVITHEFRVVLSVSDSVQTRMKVLHVISETPPSFLQHLKDLTFIEKKPLR